MVARVDCISLISHEAEHIFVSLRHPSFDVVQHFNKYVLITSWVPSTLPEILDTSENERENLPSGR